MNTMILVWKICWVLLLAVALPASAQTLAQDFADWAKRFEADMRLAESKPVNETAIFDRSQWPAGSSSKYLSEMHAAQQLFPKPRNRRVWSLGETVGFLAKEARFAGSGGTVVGADLNPNLPRETLEVIYLRLPTEFGDRLDAALKQRFGVDQLKLPPVGVLRRDRYPFLLFKRIDGKLYLAAFSKEFMTVVDAIFTLQIAEAESRPSELALTSS
jgi:hypothetical protein